MNREGRRFAKHLEADPNFWTPGQLAAFRAACAVAGVQAGRKEAERWKAQRGAALRAWRSVSRTKRAELAATVAQAAPSP